MNARTLAAAAALAAALLPLPALAQTDTAAVSVTVNRGTDPPVPASVSANAVPQARRSLNALTYEEVRNAHVSNAYELIHNLRPSWLRTPRGATSLRNHADIQVFMRGIRMGGRDQLAAIPITSIRTVRFYTATDARLRFGGETQAGAIEITPP